MPFFAVAIFTSAFLLFWVQPLFAKMILPLLGGSPAVWATAMMFFQLVLLAGYGYAHLLTHRIRSLRGQVAVHGVVVAIGLLFLPFALAQTAVPPADGSPIPWLVGVLAARVGWPFFALSASAPLLQAWFARGRPGRDPYILYAASNAGSLLALLAFPVLLEPSLTLAGQSHAWRFGYWALLFILAMIGLTLLRRAAPALAQTREKAGGWAQRLTWIALAFVPSSLLLGVTTHITTDVASAPLFWVVPFALYLLTFIIAFARPVAREGLLKAHAAGITAIAAMTLLTVVFALGGSVAVTVGLHLFTFFVTALLCHAELARRRPDASGLTSFYFCMSIGGALGGVFNALLAPAIFSSDIEYYLALVASCVLRLVMTEAPARFTARDLVFPLLLGGAVAAVAWHAVDATPFSMTGRVLFLLPVALALYYFSQVPLRFALGVAAVLGAAVLVQGSVDVLASERSFFGINKVKRLEGGTKTALVHGTTVHGLEFTDPRRWREPLAYYARSGPVGQMFAADKPRARAALVGLGTGALACYRPPGADWAFFEIDGAVARLARDTRYFHYLQQCPGSKIVLGDGRLSLKAAPDHTYELIVIDAFSSDSIPTHLLTREAFALYLKKLAPHGVILFNLSNKYLKLGPVLGTVVDSVRAFGKRRLFYPTDAQIAGGASGSEWMVIAAEKADLDFLDWPATHAEPGARPWTDDFSNIFHVIQW
ncbi:MAG: putative transporter [Alphaproteobacteria bacterium]|nr:putative transporter [Alphaproteobacteria bacterium]